MDHLALDPHFMYVTEKQKYPTVIPMFMHNRQVMLASVHKSLCFYDFVTSGIPVKISFEKSDDSIPLFKYTFFQKKREQGQRKSISNLHIYRNHQNIWLVAHFVQHRSIFAEQNAPPVEWSTLQMN